mgnify:CR=1 FL=1
MSDSFRFPDERKVRVVGPDGTVVHGRVVKAEKERFRVAFPREGTFTVASGWGLGACTRWHIHPEDFARVSAAQPPVGSALDAEVLAVMPPEPQRSRVIWRFLQERAGERLVDFWEVCASLRRLARRNAIDRHARGKSTLWSKPEIRTTSDGKENGMNKQEDLNDGDVVSEPADGVAVPPKPKVDTPPDNGVTVSPKPKADEPTPEE